MTGKQQRTVKGMFVQPKSQVRQLMGFIVGALVALAGISAILFSSIQSAVNLLVSTGHLDSDSASILQTAIRNGMIGMTFMAICLILYAAWINFRLTHRFYGPTVPIVRLAKQLKNKEYSGRIKLRKNDELVEIAEALNELAQRLEEDSKKDQS